MRAPAALVLLLGCSSALGADVVAAPPPVLERPAFSFGVGPRVAYRWFGSATGAVPAVGGWRAALGGVEVAGAWYPGAALSTGLLGNLGFFGEGRASVLGFVALDPAKPDPVYATRASLLRGGVTWRLPLGTQHQLALAAGVSSEYYGTARASTRGVPQDTWLDVTYLGPRARLGYAVALAKGLSLSAALGFTWTVSLGELEALAFPRASAFSLDLQLGAALTVLPAVQLRLSVDVAQTFLALNGGAATQGAQSLVDGSVGGALALAFSL